MVKTIQEINHMRNAGKTRPSDTTSSLDERIEYDLLKTKKGDYPEAIFDWELIQRCHGSDTIRETLHEYQKKGWSVYFRSETYGMMGSSDDSLKINISAGYIPYSSGPDYPYHHQITYEKYTGNHD